MTWLLNFAISICKTPLNWCLGFWKDMTGPVGYRGIAVVIAAYVGLYSIVEASHERQRNFAAFERNMLITMVSSGNRGSFIAAMKNFGPIQDMTAYIEPSLLEPWTWWKKTKPNSESLARWARARFDTCVPAECGVTVGEPAYVDREYRIYLNNANLQYSVLIDVDLSFSSLFAVKLQNAILPFSILAGSNLSKSNIQQTELTMADLRFANLTSANLKDSNLKKAKLQRANLEGANLEGANLLGANLREARGLNCDVLKTAKDWQLACRDAVLACSADIPEPDSCEYDAR